MEKHTSKRDLRKNAHTASNKPPQAPNSNSFHTKKRFPKNRENASIAVIFFQKNALALKNSPKTRIFSVLSNSKEYYSLDSSEKSLLGTQRAGMEIYLNALGKRLYGKGEWGN